MIILFVVMLFRLCEKVKAGNGKVYKCLFKHKFDKTMSVDVRKNPSVLNTCLRVLIRETSFFCKIPKFMSEKNLANH